MPNFCYSTGFRYDPKYALKYKMKITKYGLALLNDYGDLKNSAIVLVKLQLWPALLNLFLSY